MKKILFILRHLPAIVIGLCSLVIFISDWYEITVRPNKKQKNK